MIVTLYHEYGWEAVIAEPWPTNDGLLQQPIDVLARYFDPQMIELILRDRACAAKKSDTCRLDYDPIWDSQDPLGASAMKIEPMADPSQVSVDFFYHGGKTHVHLVYRLTRTRAGWRIADIQGTYSSLRAVLEGDFQP